MKKNNKVQNQQRVIRKDDPTRVENSAVKETNQVIKNGLADAILNTQETFGSQLSQADTLFKNLRWYMISNMRQLLSQIYIEHGLVRTIVDVPVDDGLRGGVEIHSKQLTADEIQKLQETMEREGDYTILAQALKWNRLYGGAGIVIITDQDAEEPLDLNTVDENHPLEFRAVDMWELYSDTDSSQDSKAQTYKPLKQSDHYSYYGVKLHKSRVLILKGLTPPSFIRPRLRGWGFSVIEHLVRSINQYLKATDLTFEVLDEFKLDIFKIKGLTQALISPQGEARIRQRVTLANQQKSYQNAITMDAEDDYVQKQLSFGGMSEAMEGIRMQVASDMRMPLTKIFGISAAGFSSGEDDIENYNAMVESEIRGKAKFDLLRIIGIRCQKLFGDIPDDLSITFKPLRVLSSEQEENVKNAKLGRLVTLLDKGAITPKQFKEAVNKDKLVPVQLDTTDELLTVDKDESSETTKSTGSKSVTTAKDAEGAKS